MDEWTVADIYRNIGMSHRDMAFVLGISEKNLDRWIEHPHLAEDSYRFQMIREVCVKSRGVIKIRKLGQWLNRAREDLGRYAPLTLMREIQGFKDVLRLMDSLKAGAYA